MSKQWYVFKDQQQKGPFTWEQLWQQARSGAVSPADHYWSEGMDGWTRGEQLTDLFPKPTAAPPPRPPVQPPAAVPPPRSPAPPPVAAAPPPPQRGPVPPAAAPFPQQGGFGPSNPATAPRKGKGCLIAIIFVLLVFLLGGGYFVYNYLLQNENGITLPALTEREPSSLIGAWRGVDEYGDEGYLKFNADGTMHIASPWDGYWTTVDYRIEERNNILYLEIYDTYNEEWERFSEIEVKSKDKLLLRDFYDELEVEIDRITNKQFQEIIDTLEYSDWW